MKLVEFHMDNEVNIEGKGKKMKIKPTIYFQHKELIRYRTDCPDRTNYQLDLDLFISGLVVPILIYLLVILFKKQEIKFIIFIEQGKDFWLASKKMEMAINISPDLLLERTIIMKQYKE
jgi:hypothetical protein